jgi:hypothetical protein
MMEILIEEYYFSMPPVVFAVITTEIIIIIIIVIVITKMNGVAKRNHLKCGKIGDSPTTTTIETNRQMAEMYHQ